MATTILEVFEGEATLTAEKIETLREWYASAQGDEDKTDGDDDCFYEGQRMAYQAVLDLLFNG